FVDSRISTESFAVTDPNFYVVDAYADRAVDWIEKQAGKPYFLYMAFNCYFHMDDQVNHAQATPKYLDRFKHIEDYNRRQYAALPSATDDAVGKVMARIRELGQEENTLVFFFSDNGGALITPSNNDPLRGFKRTVSEGGTRIPFCMQWKGKLPAGK